jgi:hypothetical protein
MLASCAVMSTVPRQAIPITVSTKAPIKGGYGGIVYVACPVEVLFIQYPFLLRLGIKEASDLSEYILLITLIVLLFSDFFEKALHIKIFFIEFQYSYLPFFISILPC